MYEKLTKNALKCMYIATAIGMLFILVILIPLEIFVFRANGWVIVEVIDIVLCTLALLNAIISPWFRYNRYRYKIDEECIDIVEGYIFTERNIVPIERLHKLEVNKGPIDKLCGVAKVKVTTAGGEVIIRFLDDKRADAILEALTKRINDIVKTQKLEKTEE